MNKELEVKFLKIDRQKMKKHLQEIGAVMSRGRTLMRRLVFDNPLNPASYIRIRDEGVKTTFTLKEIDNVEHIDGIKEMEIEIENFEVMKMILNKMGIKEKSYQESYRELWIKNEVEITIDERPGLKPFIEIEWPDESSIKAIVALLGFDMKKGVYGTVSEIYQLELGLTPDYINYLKELTFERPPTLP